MNYPTIIQSQIAQKVREYTRKYEPIDNTPDSISVDGRGLYSVELKWPTPGKKVIISVYWRVDVNSGHSELEDVILTDEQELRKFIVYSNKWTAPRAGQLFDDTWLYKMNDIARKAVRRVYEIDTLDDQYFLSNLPSTSY